MTHSADAHAHRWLTAGGFALFALLAWALPCHAVDKTIVPFAYWEGDIRVDQVPTWGWSVPAAITWHEYFPTAGALHPQTRYVDNDGDGFVSRGDEIEAVGPGPGVWRVEWVTTYFAFEPLDAQYGLGPLEVASGDFYLGCWCDMNVESRYHCLGRSKLWPAQGDSFFVLTPNFGQIVTVYDWFTTYLICPKMLSTDAVALNLPGLPYPPPFTYRFTKMACGVWLSWDPTTAARRSTWGELKSHYRE